MIPALGIWTHWPACEADHVPNRGLQRDHCYSIGTEAVFLVEIETQGSTKIAFGIKGLIVTRTLPEWDKGYHTYD